MRRILTVAIILSLVFSLFAQPVEETVATPVSSSITVVDMLGTEVTIPSVPERIVSGYYISSSAFIALGLTDNLVAIETGAGKRPIYKLAASSLINGPNVGSAKNFDLETCLSVEPELVVLPQKQKDNAKTLNEMGIPTLVVVPESHAQILEMFALLGKATHREVEADKLIASYREKLDLVESLARRVSEEEKPVVYMGGTGSILTTAPENMYQASLIRSVGARNAGDVLSGASWVGISYEELIAMNPDVIFIPSNSNANGTPDYTVESVLLDKELQGIKAVQNGRVYQMPIGFEAWDSPVPSGILGALWMMKTLHPDLYSQEAFPKTVQEFYSEFYGFAPDTSLL
ncbi:MAG: ABC transporter substrate-binding protein [Spirochaetales bacterium]|nr:ABC transporter substrate-binding protein [Candidatus Physcosoma equi]